jgi:hypothetical protein
MIMPETSIYEHNGTVLWEDQVRLSRQGPCVEAIAEAKTEEAVPNVQLGGGVF